MYRIGKIINTHGINGEVKVQQITDFTELFARDQVVYIEQQGKLTEHMIEQHRIHKQHHLIRFQGYESINDVEHLKGLDLKIKEEQLPQLEENQFHYHEIIGCTMETVDGEKIGEIINILAPGANDVWVVKNNEGKEHLIPYIDDVVKKVDIENKIVIIELMEGLLD